MKTLRMLFLLIALLAVACNKEDTIISGSVSGELTLYDRAAPLVKKPAAGVKIYLLDFALLADTVKNKTFRVALVDSVLTDSNGKYKIGNIPSGHYLVIPSLGETDYLFSLADDKIKNEFILSETALYHTVSFSAPLPGGENGIGWCTIYLTIKNFSVGSFYEIKRKIEPFSNSERYYRTIKIKQSTGNVLELVTDFSFEPGYGIIYNEFRVRYWKDSSSAFVDFWIDVKPAILDKPETYWEIDIENKTTIFINSTLRL
jgi:hypothetical protein